MFLNPNLRLGRRIFVLGVAVYSDAIEAAKQVIADDQARKVFRMVERNPSQSGWAIAKSLDMEPKVIEETLRKLKNMGVFDAQGSGLEGYYYLTELGFRVREMLLSRSAAV